MTQTRFNLTEAGRRIGRSRATIQRAIKKGDLSFELDENQNKQVTAAELIRVYGDRFRLEPHGKQGGSMRDGPPGGALPPDYKAMQDQLLTQYKSEVERLEAALERAQEGQSRITALIEHHRTDADRWREAMDSQAEKIANRVAAEHEKRLAEQEKRHESEIQRLKRTLHAERQKTLWRRIFG